MHIFLSLILAPFLIAQGMIVKRNTPKLPEASGDRSGSQGNSTREINLLILGDSAAAGVGVLHQDNALSGQVLLHLNTDIKVNWTLTAETGATTKQAIERIHHLPTSTFHIVITSLGVNDVTSNCPVNTWLNQQKLLIQLLEGKFSAEFIIQTAVPQMHLFPKLPQPLRWYLGRHAKNMNTALELWIKNKPNISLLQIDTPNGTNLMASDGFHPGPKIYTMWGKLAAEMINSHLSKNTPSSK